MIRALAASCFCYCSCTGFRVRKTCRACLITIIKHLSCQINPLNENWLLLLLAGSWVHLNRTGSSRRMQVGCGMMVSGRFRNELVLARPSLPLSVPVSWRCDEIGTGGRGEGCVGTDSEANWRFLVVDFFYCREVLLKEGGIKYRSTAGANRVKSRI